MMLLDLVCGECIKEQLDKGVNYNGESDPIMIPFKPLNDTGLYEFKCPNGHDSKTILDNIDFEMLFEYG